MWHNCRRLFRSIKCSWRSAAPVYWIPAMRSLTFSPAVLTALRHERYHHPHPRVQQKMEVLWLKSQGLTHVAIARLADVSRRTVQRYLDEFVAGGLDQLRRLPWSGTTSELVAHQASLEDH